ncbi:MAG: hypothetical protein LQ350_001012 [Teloschistes chrysophthalmus]|nr:MAG: hypothetical protein LQ350_001012 [Niorma chrysophthalma]
MTLVEIPQPIDPDSPFESSKKRKRPTEASEELEVDINAPEPPSKKALRKAKKGKLAVPSKSTSNAAAPTSGTPPNDGHARAITQAAEATNGEAATPSKRSRYGIWIGNLLFTTTKADLRSFLTASTQITDTSITRIHMPAPSGAPSSHQKIKSQNKGFAYVDFSTAEALAEAVGLSETLLAGRKVLIKDAKSFEGRPEKKPEEVDAKKTAAGNVKSGKPPSKRVFVGNLSFDTEKGDLEEHFAQCGEVLDVHVATFEDSGKCKGFAWVTFAEIEAAEAAENGWIKKTPYGVDDEDEEGVNEDDEGDPPTSKKPKRKPKYRKYYVNKLNGRPLRTEFAEDASVRYKKRYGKDAKVNTKTNGETLEPEAPAEVSTTEKTESKPKPRGVESQANNKGAQKKKDARNIRPGAALAAAPRLTGGIVASEGKKITFA